MIWAILASGESMSQSVADSVRGRCKVLAVSDAIQFAPWADGLVSADASWWRNKEPQYGGKRYTMGIWPETEKVEGLPMGTNSALLAVHVAIQQGATKVLLLGVDLKGKHFFGDHAPPLRNPDQARLDTFKNQFAGYHPKGVEILNCNPDSALTCYPLARVGDHLESMAQSEAPRFPPGGSVHHGTEAPGLRRRARMHAAPRRTGHHGQLEQDQGGRPSG